MQIILSVCVCLTEDEESLELRLYCGCKTDHQSTDKFLFTISGKIISTIWNIVLEMYKRIQNRHNLCFNLFMCVCVCIFRTRQTERWHCQSGRYDGEALHFGFIFALKWQLPCIPSQETRCWHWCNLWWVSPFALFHLLCIKV